MSYVTTTTVVQVELQKLRNDQTSLDLCWVNKETVDTQKTRQDLPPCRTSELLLGRTTSKNRYSGRLRLHDIPGFADQVMLIFPVKFSSGEYVLLQFRFLDSKIQVLLLSDSLRLASLSNLGNCLFEMDRLEEANRPTIHRSKTKTSHSSSDSVEWTSIDSCRVERDDWVRKRSKATWSKEFRKNR